MSSGTDIAVRSLEVTRNLPAQADEPLSTTLSLLEASLHCLAKARERLQHTVSDAAYAALATELAEVKRERDSFSARLLELTAQVHELSADRVQLREALREACEALNEIRRGAQEAETRAYLVLHRPNDGSPDLEQRDPPEVQKTAPNGPVCLYTPLDANTYLTACGRQFERAGPSILGPGSGLPSLCPWCDRPVKDEVDVLLAD